MLSERALRDYAYRVLKSMYGEHKNEYGIIIPATASDKELADFASTMPKWQIKQMYNLIYKSEMVE